MHRFFCEQPEQLFLSDEESHHALKVLRLQTGNEFEILNGRGSIFTCRIEDHNGKILKFSILKSENYNALTPKIHIAIAPTKNIDRFEFFLEKVCEIGINQITPIKCKNSERKEIKQDKLQKKLVSASKQSGQTHFPILDDIKSFNQFLKETEKYQGLKLIAHCDNDTEKVTFNKLLQTKQDILILIGPEGDFSKEEIILAKENKFDPVSLGNSRLRTETAGIVACANLRYIFSY